jgi:hypothetical protein
MPEFETYLLDSATWHELCCHLQRISIQIQILSVE